jgi:DNA-binding transcriptional LysR family regulator
VLEQLDWDDVRVFLAMLRAGSLRRVAQDLGISHPTASRRLRAMEAQLGLHLFDRRSDGLHATPAALELARAAEDVERAMQVLGRVALAADPKLRGTIRVTAPAAFLTDLLMPDLLAFQQRWPDIELELQASSSLQDLAAREADVAIRTVPVGQSPDGELAGRRAASAHMAVYGSGDCWLGPEAVWPPFAQRHTPEFGALPVRGSFPTMGLKRAACAAGLGYARLPCFYADPTLPRRSEPALAGDVWVLVHPDLRRNPRLRVFRDFVVDALRRHQPRLSGGGHALGG